MIEIETSNGAEVTATSTQRFPSAANKKALIAEPIDTANFPWEGHHRLYGRPWILGRFHFDTLISHGLRPDHHFLDLGCGAGRVGSWVAGYLDPDRYFGIDAHLLALRAFAEYEALLHGLGPKRPRLMWSDSFDVDLFGVHFDIVFDSYVTPHLSDELAEHALSTAAKYCNDGARLFSNNPRLAEVQLAASGWTLLDKFETTYPMFDALQVQSRDAWSVYERRS